VPDEPCETPTLLAVMSEKGDPLCAFKMRKGVKRRTFLFKQFLKKRALLYFSINII
jgi:hypothetical protein